MSERELVVAMRPGLSWALASGDGQALSSALELGCALATGVPSASLRTGPVLLDADTDGTTVEFCDWTLVPTLLAGLQRNILESGLPPTAKSIASLVGLLNIHPFVDGNGRCARLLFNTVLDSHFSTGAVLPIRVLLEHSSGGFEISMRDAEINNRWSALLRYFLSAFELLAEFATGPAVRLMNPVTHDVR